MSRMLGRQACGRFTFSPRIPL